MGQVKTSVSHKVSQYHRSRHTGIWRGKKLSSLPDSSAPCPLLLTFRSFMWNSGKLLRKISITWDRMKVLNSIALLTPLHTGASGDRSGLHQHHLHPWGPQVFRQVNEQSCILPRTFIPSVSPVSPQPRQDHSDMHSSSFQQLLCIFTGTQLGIAVALKANSQIQTFYFMQKAEWAKVIHKKEVFWGFLFVCFCSFVCSTYLWKPKPANSCIKQALGTDCFFTIFLVLFWF